MKKNIILKNMVFGSYKENINKKKLMIMLKKHIKNQKIIIKNLNQLPTLQNLLEVLQ